MKDCLQQEVYGRKDISIEDKNGIDEIRQGLIMAEKTPVGESTIKELATEEENILEEEISLAVDNSRESNDSDTPEEAKQEKATVVEGVVAGFGSGAKKEGAIDKTKKPEAAVDKSKEGEKKELNATEMVILLKSRIEAAVKNSPSFKKIQEQVNAGSVAFIRGELSKDSISSRSLRNMLSSKILNSLDYGKSGVNKEGAYFKKEFLDDTNQTAKDVMNDASIIELSGMNEDDFSVSEENINKLDLARVKQGFADNALSSVIHEWAKINRARK